MRETRQKMRKDNKWSNYLKKYHRYKLKIGNFTINFDRLMLFSCSTMKRKQEERKEKILIKLLMSLINHLQDILTPALLSLIISIKVKFPTKMTKILLKTKLLWSRKRKNMNLGLNSLQKMKLTWMMIFLAKSLQSKVWLLNALKQKYFIFMRSTRTILECKLMV